MSDVAMRYGQALDGAAGPLMLSQPSLPLVASVEVHADPRAALADWRDLAAAASATPYQTPDWLLPWIDTVGAAIGIEPMIVVARNEGGQAMALLPFGLLRQGRLTTAVFLGAKDSNFNMGLFRSGPLWTRAALLDLLRRAARASGRRVDLFALRNQPHGWEGAANPLLALPGQPSPSFAYKARLAPDPDAFFKAQLSRESRKKLRQKMNRLRAFGSVEVLEARTPAEIVEVLDAFVEQRTMRCAAYGLPVDEIPLLRRFLDRATAPAGPGGEAAGPVEFHGLRCGTRIVATLGGVRRGGRFSGMLTSFTAHADLKRTSPGELLLAEVMRHHCEKGTTTFDLGVGEARYKETYCPDVEPLFDSLVPLTPRGHVHARAEALRLQAKRSIKQSTWAWPVVQRLRRLRAAISRGRADEPPGRED